ncbi:MULTISPECIES: glycoside hydrolase family 13 protein [Vibrio]|uniref:Alpha-glycosidase n=1 Tax=Vibrio tasmaniensis TaxID=212663 RepID=A0A2N7NF26_9VIBR|nr:MULTISPECIES: glycoside hydrolase family 13 protein [Vibrio]PMP11661.1 alpha-glycosidase [Vibrio tasmaniensis]TKG34796.1 alpha-glycosidase [Vibrio tasmaniensis]TKG40438.1 alpha-glycosidase [Vibrio tasmaniensis]TKG48738.1 alpha-glycosidase [Vibrio tasmaniensis]TKG49714.1 alpha-glycosidase [Vibrio tasmaniensis]
MISAMAITNSVINKPITKSSLTHSAKSADSYAYNNETLHLRLRCAKGELDKVSLWIGDPYHWAEGGLDGGNLGGSDAHGWVGGNEVTMIHEGETEYHDHWFAEFTPPKRRSRYGFILYGKGGEKILFGEKRCADISTTENAEIELSNLSNFFCFPYINPRDVLKTPTWIKDTIWYQIFPERFANGRPETSPANVQPWGTRPVSDNFMGGDLWGVIDKLDYLQDLGVNGLYLCPIFTANANHKYDTVDYYNVDPHFGGNEAFKALVDEAHKRGMKIMLDAVFNHIGSQSPLWLDVVNNGAKSKYADWFWINQFPVYPDTPKEDWDFWNLNYETFANVVEMPKLNTENEECRAYLLDVARHWVEEFNIDGWRLDVANEVDHAFWRDFRKVVKDANPDCYILGEIWHEGMPWLRGDQYDSLMNYPLTQAITDYFGLGDVDKESFVNAVNASYMAYPRNVNEAMFNLLDSHDTTRIISLCQGDKRKAKLAYLFMFTQVGAPCIYYGGEIGMDGGRGMGSEDNRKCMIWEESEQDLEFKNFIQEMIALRKANPDFNQPCIDWLNVEDEKGTADKECIAYLRGNLMFVLNNSDKDKQIMLDGKSLTISAYGYVIEQAN